MKIIHLILFLALLGCEDAPKTVASNPGVEEVPQIATIEKVVPKKAIRVTSPPKKYRFPYNLNEPILELKLSKKLTEISGLSFNEDESELIAINDEQGKLFYLDKRTGNILKEEKFHKKGDYEGVEVANSNIFVLKNNGTIYQHIAGKKRPKPKAYKTALDETYDVEGLGYDARKNQLLLACKGKAGEGTEFKQARAIYAFDLKKMELLPNPKYLISQWEIDAYLGKNAKTDRSLKSSILKPIVFAPSAIAVHPKSRHIYILSSIGKSLVVLNHRGKIISIQKMEKDLIQQPEGICFDKSGALYLSSEGKTGKGRIFKFVAN